MCKRQAVKSGVYAKIIRRHMYLKQLELSGFKSFAKKSELAFSSSISAIVGPNGSGKSNVAEAFRFVLGEQSIKSLRGKRGEDLIWNGSSQAPKANRASVKVTFDNTRRFLNVDFDEVAIERVVHRDSTNEYFINGSRVRLKDILELLAAAHIGSSGHHIISQGEADRILSANSRERKQMIEDALGLKVYHYKKEESRRKLQKTDDNIASVESLRREIAPHLKFLKKQMEKVERARQLKEELRSLYAEYLKREEAYLKNERAVIEEGRRGPKEELARLEKELGEARAVLEKNAQGGQVSKEILALEEKIKSARAERDRLTREMGRIEGEIASEERIIKRGEEMAKSEDAKTVPLKDVESLAGELEIRIKEAEHSDDLGFIRRTIHAIRDAVQAFVSRNRTLKDDGFMTEARSAISRLSEERESIEEKLGAIRMNEQELQKVYASMREDLEKEKDDSRDAEKAIFRIMSEQNNIHSQLSRYEERDLRLRVEEENFKRELQEAAVLIGRAVLDYQAHDIKRADGSSLSLNEMAAEPRPAQEERRRNIEKIKIRIEDAGGAGGDDVVKEFRETSERDEFLAKELADLMAAAESLMKLITDLELKLDAEFKEGMKKINTEFQRYFALMFGGGTASLSVVREKKRVRKLLSDDDAEMEETEPDAPEETEGEEGIEVDVSLPRKKVKGLTMLSGGERALTSIALLFAISQVNPPPFVILDETDAALDEANSRKYGDMIENLSSRSQLILITHNRETMSRAGILYGVTMGADGVSRLLSVQFEEAAAVAK